MTIELKNEHGQLTDYNTYISSVECDSWLTTNAVLQGTAKF